MVQGLVQQLGGKVVLSSVKGGGTTADIWLRVALGTAENVPIEEEPHEPETELATTDPLVTLAVDDDPLVLENTAAMLIELGHKVLQAHSGAEALSLLDERTVDLIVTDYATPGMTGEELTKHILATQPDLPVLMVSGYASLPEGTGTSAPKLGKPFKERELARAIADVLALKRAA
jgi:CheY-like chemotaxis protein